MKRDLVFAAEVRKRRHEKHLSQAELAARLGCSQTSISNIENGQLSSISQEKFIVLCKALGLSGEDWLASSSRLAYCGNPDCPLGWREVVNGELIVLPAVFHVPDEGLRFCKACGRPLLLHCQEAKCKSRIHEGSAFCVNCGAPLVPTEKHHRIGDLEEYKARMNGRTVNYLAAAEKIDFL